MLKKLLAAVLAALIWIAPVTAHAQLLLGVGHSKAGVATFTGLGAAFQEDIAIAGGGALGAALNVTNTKTVTVGCWFWTPHFQNGTVNNRSRGWPVPMCLRSNGNGACENTSVAAAFCMALDSASSVSFVQLNFPDNVASGGAHTYQINGNGTGKTTWTSGCWNFVLLSFSLGVTSHSAIMRGACGSTPVDVGNLHGTGDYVTNNYQNITPDLNNSTGVVSGQPGMGWANTNQTDLAYGWQSITFVAEEAMVCTAAGAPYADCVSADTIAPSTLARFGHVDATSGNWVPNVPGTDCSVYSPTGRTPEVCLYGEGDGMIANHGTADSGTGSPATAFTKIQIDPGAQLWKPPYGPAGIPAHQATLRWLQHYHPTASGTTSSSLAITGTGQGPLPVTVGDLLVIAGGVDDASNIGDHALTCPTGGANTWTAVGPATDHASHNWNAIVCWTIAQSGDTTGPWVVNWTTANSRDLTWILADYANVASVDFAAIGFNASGATGVTPAGHTTANANETVISGLISFSTNKIYTPPATGMTRWRYPNISTAMQNTILDANATTEGAAIPSGTNTQVSWGLSANDSSFGWTLAVVPN